MPKILKPTSNSLPKEGDVEVVAGGNKGQPHPEELEDEGEEDVVQVTPVEWDDHQRDSTLSLGKQFAIPSMKDLRLCACIEAIIKTV